MSHTLSVRSLRCCFEGRGAGPAINDRIRSDNDKRSNSDSPNATKHEGARGEREAQFLETDWKNIIVP